MNTVRQFLKRLVEANVSTRTAVVMAICSGALLLSLMVVWLGMSTRTALLDKQLEDLDAQQTRLTDQINQTWTEIGEVTSPREMEPRARRLGFAPAVEIEYLVVTPEATLQTTATMTAMITTTMTTTATNALTATVSISQ